MLTILASEPLLARLLTLWSMPFTNLPGFSDVPVYSLFLRRAAISIILKHFLDFKYSCDAVRFSCAQITRPELALIPSTGPHSGRPLNALLLLKSGGV